MCIRDRQRSARWRRLARITRTIGDYAVDWTANLRVTKLRGRAFVLAFGRRKLSPRPLHLLLLARRLQGRKMLLGHFVLRLSLDQRNRRFVELLAWESALLEENAAAVINLLLRVVRFLRRLQIKFSLLPFFRQSGRGLKPVGRLRLLVRALVLDLGSGEIAVLRRCRGREQGHVRA